MLGVSAAGQSLADVLRARDEHCHPAPRGVNRKARFDMARDELGVGIDWTAVNATLWTQQQEGDTSLRTIRVRESQGTSFPYWMLTVITDNAVKDFPKR